PAPPPPARHPPPLTRLPLPRVIEESVRHTPLEGGPNLNRSVHVALLALVPVISACSANHYSVFRHEQLDPTAPSVVTLDAKQRAILKANAVGGISRFCSEPSPDVFTVVAQALSAGAGVNKSADPASLEATLKAAFSSAELGSTIPRTQTINMLRELMFRTCERFLNGAYSDLEMSIQAIRDQRLMISILAIEQLTGAVTPRPVVIGAGGSGAAGAGGDAIVRLDDAKKAREAASAALPKAQKEFDDLNGDAKVCDGIATTLASGKPLSEEQKPHAEKCTAAAADLAAAKQRDTDAAAYYAQLSRLVESGGVSVATYLTSTAAGGIDRAHSESVATVAKSVETIVTRNFDNETEVLLFCLRSLSDPDTTKVDTPKPAASPSGSTESKGSPPDSPGEGAREMTANAALDKSLHDPGLRATCLAYLMERAESERRELRLSAEASASAKALEVVQNDQFTRFWPKLQAAVATPAGKTRFVQDLKKSLPPSEADEADCFAGTNDESGYRACFLALRPPVQRRLTGE
ncbi:MAG TPA: hypothetical protein VMQ62_10600, partial [Dongiaceae bacterium]|nr:hypothetical protein [Dongiaceae bacterium]